MNATKKEYTWTKFSQRYKPVKQRQEARLDLAFITPSLLAYVKKFEHKKLIKSTKNNSIDHKALIITIDYLNFKPGPGVFRVPKKIIDRLDYGKTVVTSMRRTINEHKEEPQPDWSLHGWTTREHYSRLTKEVKGKQILEAMISNCILETQNFTNNLNVKECN